MSSTIWLEKKWNPIWIGVENSLFTCTHCEESILGKSFVLYLQYGQQQLVEPTDIILCTSCKESAKIKQVENQSP